MQSICEHSARGRRRRRRTISDRETKQRVVERVRTGEDALGEGLEADGAGAVLLGHVASSVDRVHVLEEAPARDEAAETGRRSVELALRRVDELVPVDLGLEDGGEVVAVRDLLLVLEVGDAEVVQGVKELGLGRERVDDLRLAGDDLLQPRALGRRDLRLGVGVRGLRRVDEVVQVALERRPAGVGARDDKRVEHALLRFATITDGRGG